MRRRPLSSRPFAESPESEKYGLFSKLEARREFPQGLRVELNEMKMLKRQKIKVTN